MPVDKDSYLLLRSSLDQQNVTLVAVSKTKSPEEILALYELGQRDFGENYVQELVQKADRLPGDIRWHFIGHLQRNKVKQIAPIVQLIQGVDSLRLLKEIDSQGKKLDRKIDCLLQVHIAKEETKFGFDEAGLAELIQSLSMQQLSFARICGLMGMASFTGDTGQLRQEFRNLKNLFDKYLGQGSSQSGILSMGMSADYRLAIEEGSTMVRIGSLVFGEREKK